MQQRHTVTNQNSTFTAETNKDKRFSSNNMKKHLKGNFFYSHTEYWNALEFAKMLMPVREKTKWQHLICHAT